MSGAPPAPILILQPDDVRIPRALDSLESFRAWTASAAFPESGRIDWIDGELEVDMSPEDLHAHGTLKVAIARDLSALVEGHDLGSVYSDSTRLVSEAANLSVEPDVVVVLFASHESGRVRFVPRAGTKGGSIEMEGAPDIVVECVSDSSRRKDVVRLREGYYAAGIPEYWIADGRVAPPVLTLLRRGASAYEETPADAEGFARSAVLGRNVRIVRLPPRGEIIRYRVEMREA